MQDPYNSSRGDGKQETDIEQGGAILGPPNPRRKEWKSLTKKRVLTAIAGNRVKSQSFLVSQGAKAVRGEWSE